MSFPIDTTIPNAPNDPADDQPKMQLNYLNIFNNLAVDHVDPGLVNNGFHKQTRIKAQTTMSGLPAGLVAGIGTVYTRTLSPSSVTELFYVPDATSNQYRMTFTDSALFSRFGTRTIFSGTTGGWTFLPGGLILNYGFINSPVNNSTVTFAKPFPNFLLSVTLGGVTASTTDKTINIKDGSQGLSSFQVITSGTSAFTVLYYVAIGN